MRKQSVTIGNPAKLPTTPIGTREWYLLEHANSQQHLLEC